MSRSCHTARLGSLASSRMMAGSQPGGAPGGGTVAAATASVGVSVSCDLGGFRRWEYAGGNNRLDRRTAADDGRDFMASVTSGSRCGGAGVASGRSPTGRQAVGAIGEAF